MKKGLVTDPDAVGVGRPRRRQDAHAKVRGEFDYATDLSAPDMLWEQPFGRCITPLLGSVNLDAARRMPGCGPCWARRTFRTTRSA